LAIYSYTATTLDGTVIEGVVEASDEKIASKSRIPASYLTNNSSQNRTEKTFAFKSARGDLLPSRENYRPHRCRTSSTEAQHPFHHIGRKGDEKVIMSVLKLIREGNAFSDAMKYPRVFPKLYVVWCGPVKQACPDIVLEKLNEFLKQPKNEKQHHLRHDILILAIGVWFPRLLLASLFLNFQSYSKISAGAALS
jgi:hypothetical protein